MNQCKVAQFKNLQNRLASKIAKVNKISNYAVEYEQSIPSAYTDPKTGKMVVNDLSQSAFQTNTIKPGKNRVIVIMEFQGKKKLNCVGKILKRGYKVYPTQNGVKICSSFIPHTISKI